MINLFIGGININHTEKDVRTSIETIAHVVEINLIRYRHQTQNRGFGFITVDNEADAEKLTTQEVKIEGKRVDIYKAQTKDEILKEKPNDRKLFVGGMSDCISDEALRKFFGQYGTLRKGYVIREIQTKKSKGFGFIEYEDPKIAKLVYEIGRFNFGQSIIEVKKMQSKIDLIKSRSCTNFSEIKENYEELETNGFGYYNNMPSYDNFGNSFNSNSNQMGYNAYQYQSQQQQQQQQPQPQQQQQKQQQQQRRR